MTYIYPKFDFVDQNTSKNISASEYEIKNVVHTSE